MTAERKTIFFASFAVLLAASMSASEPEPPRCFARKPVDLAVTAGGSRVLLIGRFTPSCREKLPPHVTSFTPARETLAGFVLDDRDRVTSLVPFPDGGFIAVALRDPNSDHWTGRLHRVLPTGERHARFSTAAAEHRGAIGAVVTTPESKVIFSTHSWVQTGSLRMPSAKLFRLDAEGRMDASFAPRTDLLVVSSLAVQSGNRLVVAGTARRGETLENLLRLLPNGERDETFRPDILETPVIFRPEILETPVIAVVADANDRLYVVTKKDVTPPRPPGGDLCPTCGASYHPQIFEYRLARLAPDGKTEKFFEEVVTEEFLEAGSTPPIQLAGVDARGRLHYLVKNELRSFLDDSSSKVTLAKDVVVAQVGPAGPSYCTRTSGKKSSCFLGDARSPLSILRPELPVTAIASTGSAVAVGRSFPAPDLDSHLIAYDLETGRADEAFNARAAAAVAGNVTSITVAKDGKVYVTGGSGYVAGDPETDPRPLVRLKRNGTLDRSFRVDEKLSDRSGFESFEARDGGVYFSYYPSVEPHDTRAGLVRLRANGTLDESFPRPRFPNVVRAYAYHAPTGVVFADPGSGPWKLCPDGKKLPFAMPPLKGPAGWIAVAGNHLYLQSLSLSFNDGGMGRVDLNGVPDDSYKKRAAVALGDLPVCRATFDDSGRAYVTMVHSGSLFRLNADGTRDPTFPSFDSHIQGNCEATATPLPNGEVLLTGRYFIGDERYSLLHLDASGHVKQRLFPVD